MASGPSLLETLAEAEMVEVVFGLVQIGAPQAACATLIARSV